MEEKEENTSITPGTTNVNEEKKTPEKTNPSQVQETNISTPKKENKNELHNFKTPEKIVSNKPNDSIEKRISAENKTPEKISCNIDVKVETESESFSQCDGEEGMISTTEQARLLIAASKTPSKSANRTPVKQSTPNGKRSLENSPVTPGRCKRAELITLSSPKIKRLKQI